jgi:hypothetical protein
MVITLTRSKQTAGTVVFSANDPDAAVTTLYIRKRRGFDDVKDITLTVEAASANGVPPPAPEGNGV